jgi:glycosyltransferase involved in cell wall biosynthesis
MEAMRILLVITRGDVLGGAQSYLRDLAIRLQADGHNVFVVTGATGAMTDILAKNGIEIKGLPGLLRDIDPVQDFRTVGSLHRAIRAFRPDLVSAHSSKAGILGRVAAKLAGVPCVFTVHGWAFNSSEPEPKRTLYRWLERAVAPLSARIIGVSNHSLELGIKAGIRASRMTTIHNGIPDIGSIAEAGTGKNMRVISVARFAAPKDHDTLIRAVSLAPNITLDLVGDGPDESAARKLVDELSLGDRVRFLGRRSDVADLLAQSDAFALCSRSEGFPISTLEAMRAALPVIVSNVGGAPEAVIDGQTGFVVHDNTVQSWVSALSSLAEDRQQRQAMGLAGRERYLSHFTFDRMYAETIQVYAHATRRLVSIEQQSDLEVADNWG